MRALPAPKVKLAMVQGDSGTMDGAARRVAAAMSVLSDLRAARKVIAQRGPSPHATRRTLATQLAESPRARPPARSASRSTSPTPAVNLYQIRQWYAPLAELAKTHPVAIITRSPGASLTLLDESPVPVVYMPPVTDLEQFVDEQDLRIVFYVNQNTKNFQMFRYGRMWHVFINHGESDKMYMTTNQFKAYDYAFVAGSGRARPARRASCGTSTSTRKAIPIGRPQADHFAGAAAVHPR